MTTRPASFSSASITLDKRAADHLMDLSIVIVNFRAWQHLKACLHSLNYLVDAGTPSCEVIVVDNQSADGQLAEFRQSFGWVRWLENTANRGFANGCNLGAETATGETLLFLNPDCVDHSQAVASCWELAGGRSQITSVQQRGDQGQARKVGGQFPRWWTMAGPGRLLMSSLRRVGPTKMLDNHQWVTGAFLMIRQRDYQALGGWDDQYFMYSEDVDLCRRAERQGLPCVVLSQCSIIHHHGGSSRINPQVRALTRSEVVISRHRYIQQHLTGARRKLAHSQVLLFEALPAMVISWLAAGTSVGQRGRYLRRFYQRVSRLDLWSSPHVQHPPEL